MSRQHVIIGIDLNRTSPQICTYERESGDTQIAPMKAGNEIGSLQETFETLERLHGEGRLHAEAMEALQEEGALFLKQAFETRGITDLREQILGITVTVERLTRPLVKWIRGMFYRLELERERTFVQDYRESMYYHTVYQKPELWQRNVGFFLFNERDVTFFSMSTDNMARPMTARIDEGITIHLAEDRHRWDEQLYNMANASLRQNLYSSLFLVGETFDKSWAGRSIGLLCKGGRKVFVVDNLFARGACYAAREKTDERQRNEYLYISDDLVRNSIGMDMTIQGLETFYPLLSAGVNWYETEKECECLLTDKPELIFVIGDAQEERKQLLRMALPGMPPRPPKATRIRLHLMYIAPGKCQIEVEDLGFGELYPSSGKVWRELWENKT